MDKTRILVVDPFENECEHYEPESRFYYAQKWGVPVYTEYHKEPCWMHLSTQRKGVGSLEAAKALAGEDAPIYQVDLNIPYKDRYKGGKGLVIGNGNSALGALCLPDSYDIKVCANAGYPWFTDRAEREPNWYWFAPEADSFMFDWYRKVPKCFKRILNPMRKLFPLEVWEPDVEMLMVERSWNEPLNVREYGTGLQDHSSTMMGSGTFVLNSLHLLSIMGCDQIDVIGCELDWNGGKEGAHFYDKPSVNPQEAKRNFYLAAEIVASQLKFFEQQGVDVNWLCDSKALEMIR